VTAIKAARILPISGAPLENGVILVENGKITALGTEVPIPAGAQVIDAGPGVVLPGFIDAHSSLGVAGMTEESRETTAHLSILPAVNPQDPNFQRAREAGITTVGVVPGPRTTIGGLVAAVKTVGATVDEMLLRDRLALRVTLGAESTWGNIPIRSGRPTDFYWRRPTTRMGVVWEVRKAFFEARKYLEEGKFWKEEVVGPGQAPRYREEALTILADALRGNLPVWFTAHREADIRTALRIADEFELQRYTLDECTEGYRVVEEIARRNVPVVVGPLYYYPTRWIDQNEGRKICLNNAGLLAEAGVKVALTTSDAAGIVHLPLHAAFAVRHGLPPEVALKAITLNAAEILGVADRVGSLEVGKDADLVILSGDPLAATTRVEQVWISGQRVFPAR